jgi:hypothetical protein
MLDLDETAAALQSRLRNARSEPKGNRMKRYEKPRLLAAGSFRKATGLLAHHGNDRLIFSKN